MNEQNYNQQQMCPQQQMYPQQPMMYNQPMMYGQPEVKLPTDDETKKNIDKQIKFAKIITIVGLAAIALLFISGGIQFIQNVTRDDPYDTYKFFDGVQEFFTLIGTYGGMAALAIICYFRYNTEAMTLYETTKINAKLAECNCGCGCGEACECNHEEKKEKKAKNNK